MANKEYYGLVGTLTATLSNTASVLAVSPSVAGPIYSSGFINGTDDTYISIRTGPYFEIVRVTGVDGNYLTAVRGQLGTSPQVFPVGSLVAFEVTSAGIIEEIGAVTTDVTITGTGSIGVTETSPNVFVIDSPIPTFTGDDRISVLGSYPDFQFVFQADDDTCCGGDGGSSGSGDGITNIVGEGLVTAFVNGTEATVRVTPPVFTAGAGVSIVGNWPAYTISATSGSGTVSSVTAGAGITVTGSPTVNPTVSITNTGVVAGTYGGVVINARGQIAAVPTTFNPVSIVTAGTGIVLARVGDAVTVSAATAAIGVVGAVALADETDPFDPTNNTEAATPAVIATALDALVLPVLNGNDNYTAETATLYTANITGSITPINIAAGQKALVTATCTVLDGAAPATPVAFGMAIFDASATMVKGNRSIAQIQQTLQFVVNGPVTSTYVLSTTAIPAGATVQSYNLSIAMF